MPTVIRYARHGSKKRPYFRVVVTDSRNKRDGRYIEHIGAYNPVVGGASFTIQQDRLDYWLSVGAQLSESVANQLKKGTTPTQGKTRKQMQHEAIANAPVAVAEKPEEPAAEAAPAETEAKAPEDKPAEAKAEAAPAEDKPAEDKKAEEAPAEKAEDKKD